MAFTGMQYNPSGAGSISTVDAGSSAPSKSQLHAFFWLKKAIITARREQFFSPLASVVGMPKNFGKEIKVYEYVPLLDDRNNNNQGLDASGATISNGNLYGSSKDYGTIAGKIPVLSESGGRVNRVGFTRIQRSGSLAKFGFFYEFTKESLDFDTDDQLNEHLATELMNGAVQLTEAVLQKELLDAAGTVLFAGAATSTAQVTGEGATPSVVNYNLLMRLSQTLTDNRTPKQTKVISGSRLVDTKTIPAGRVMFIGSELVSVIKKMTDPFGLKAFIPVHMYADAGDVLNGEIGTVDEFRIVVAPDMQHWNAAGAEATGADPGLYRTEVSTADGKSHYNVYPMLVIGDDSFTTIGFQTDGKSAKFSVITKMPGTDTADRNDPYGEQGFSSIKWYHGTLIKRSERIGMIKTVAPK